MERMNTIRGFTDEHSGILISDAGVILQNLHVYANEHGHLFPLDLGSKGTCQIGGNVVSCVKCLYICCKVHGSLIDLRLRLFFPIFIRAQTLVAHTFVDLDHYMQPWLV